MNNLNTCKEQMPELQINKLGFDFGEVTQMNSPGEAIFTLLACIGNIFQCERVYVFRKNEEGNYDCTDEWVCETSFPKKHLMQNINAKGVKYYYNYFLRGMKVCFRDIEDLKQEDYLMYRLLKPQDLNSVLCGQMMIDGADMGFLGVDNPASDRFDDLERIYDVINHFVAIQLHRRNLEEMICNDSQPIADAKQQIRQYSLYDRVSKIRMEEPFAVIYCDTALKYDEMQKDEGVTERMLSHTEKVLGSVFGPLNVFQLNKSEFLVFYEDNEDMDISNLNRYAALVQGTLESMNIAMTMGASVTKRYQADIFDLIHSANVKMIRTKQKYRNQYTQKYHFQDKELTFLNLIEIRPKENYFQVLYSETQHLKKKSGMLDSLVDDISRMIYIGERDRFVKFWADQLKHAEEIDLKADTPEVKTETFSIEEDGKVTSVGISVVYYTDVKGDPVLMCYTK